MRALFAYAMSANYKDTLLLPRTEFPMKADLVKREPERLAKWEEAGLYERVLDARKDAPLFVLHDGPPFANGDVHMGTALNKVLAQPEVRTRLQELAATPDGGTPDKMRQFAAAEIKRWREVVKESGASAE